ncbi:hypothetical protein MBLNU230_g6359t1 [Neophaeotheca triangularis]
MSLDTLPKRKTHRTIIHFDYDCFYASVFEAKNPALKSLPFAVQQKQIIVTCNYEARRRGLHKLQLVREAKRVCPDVIIELGEDISRFRDASKELYRFLAGFSWSGKVERLGFDEVWLDVSDMVNYNVEVLNHNDLENAFFQTVKDDPTQGFSFDASAIAGHPYPKEYTSDSTTLADPEAIRLRLGGHLALYIRHQLEQRMGYTSTVGIATSKVLSKLVGNLNKPKGQTTLMSPKLDDSDYAQNFMDSHEIGKVPGIGFKLAQKLREFALQRHAEFDTGLVYGGTKERITVADLRKHPNVDHEMLEKLLAGPGSPHGIGYKIWCLLNAVDDTEVGQARPVPRQISIEDSYIRLDTMLEVLKELNILARSLIIRMRADLLEEDEEDQNGSSNDAMEQDLSQPGQKWLAHPKTLRLTTRPRQPLQPDGTRVRSFKRISHSASLPMFVFGLSEGVDALAEKLVDEALVGMFRKLHPEKAGWNLSLVNLAVTNMAETAGESKTANGRDIGSMFKRQDKVLKDFRVTDNEPIVSNFEKGEEERDGEDTSTGHETFQEEEGEEDAGWDDSGEFPDTGGCHICGMSVPSFAMHAHMRFHELDKT